MDPREGKLHPTRRPDAGIARGPGLAVAAVTAAVVFVIGLEVFPSRLHQPLAPPLAPPVVTPPPPAPTPVADAAAATATPPALDAGAVAVKAPDAGAAVPEKKEEAAEKPTPAPEEKAATEESSAGAGDRKPIDKQSQADRDLAREAWRRNRPDISVNGNKTAILIPIKGSIKGSDFKILDKKRKVIVTLPKAVSMVTLRVYNLKHPSFKKVWIDQDEANAQPADGTKLRFVLGQTLDPQVEITDDFVRVTIRRPESSDAPADEKHSAKREKHSERAEKPSSEPAEEPAPAEKD
jgi:hypothetical protein